MYYFKLYGLNLASEIVLPLPALDKAPHTDITVSLTPDIPTSLTNAHEFKDYQIGTDKRVLLNGPFGSLLIKAGKTIEVKLNRATDLALAIQYVLGSGMAIILYQRQTLVLHASAVSKNGEAILIVGKSGFGKSTTAALLQTQGYQLLADDLSVIHFYNGQPWVQPAHPTQKVALDVLKKMEVPFSASKKTTADGRLKYFHEAQTFSDKPAVIKYIYYLRKSAQESATITQESDLIKFHQVYRNSFRFKLIAHLGFSQKHLSLCQDLFKQTKVFCLERPLDELNLDRTLKVIQDNQKKTITQQND